MRIGLVACLMLAVAGVFLRHGSTTHRTYNVNQSPVAIGHGGSLDAIGYGRAYHPTPAEVRQYDRLLKHDRLLKRLSAGTYKHAGTGPTVFFQADGSGH